MATLEYEGINEISQKLDRLLLSNPDMEYKVQTIVRKVLTKARRAVEGKVPPMKSDPKQAKKAVRMSVYKRILGGNLNIAPARKAGVKQTPPPSKRGRSQRTTDLLSYYGKDRGFILRFLNAGTQERQAETMNAHTIKAKSSRGSRLGGRGHISSRNWFAGASHAALENAAQNLSNMIDKLILEQFGG